MNEDLRKLWIQNYPLWPDSLIEKFSAAIEIEANRFSDQFGDSYKTFFIEKQKISRKFSLGQASGKVNYNFRILSPSNPRYTMSQTRDFGPQWYYANLVPALDWLGMPANYFGEQDLGPSAGLPPQNFFQGIPTFTWDSRLFSGDLMVDVKVFYTDTGYTADYSYLAIMSYNSIRVRGATSEVYFLFRNPPAPYNYAASIIALHENGVDLDSVDYQNLYDFFTYLQSYQQYEAQIQSAVVVAQKTAANDLAAYKNDLQSKIIQQRNDLQNVTLQLSTQTQNEAASAKRDIAQLSLQALSIKLQLSQAIRK